MQFTNKNVYFNFYTQKNLSIAENLLRHNVEFYPLNVRSKKATFLKALKNCKVIFLYILWHVYQIVKFTTLYNFKYSNTEFLNDPG